MSLSAVIADVESRQKTLRVFNPDPETEADVVEELSAFFRHQNVAVRGEETPSGRPESFAVLSLDELFLAAVSLGDLEEMMTSAPAGPGGLGIDDSAYHDVLQYLKETTFTSYSKSQMVTVSKEIEDRAWRVGNGRLFAGFQYTSIMKGQERTYEDLAKRDLEINAYGVPDETLPELAGVHLHVEESEELASTWFVVFDGGTEAANKSALLAEERSPDQFYGFWTYDPGIVDRIIDHLETTYDRVSQ